MEYCESKLALGEVHEKRRGGGREGGQGGRKRKRGMGEGKEKKIGQEVKGTMYRPLHRTGRIEDVWHQRAYRTASKRTENTQ